MGWLPKNHSLIEKNPDAFLQRYLYLGIHPMIPFPGNDHSQQSNPTLEKYFVDYAPLFELMRGRKWVLSPKSISCTNAKANLFKIPTGYFIPIMLSNKDNVSVK